MLGLTALGYDEHTDFDVSHDKSVGDGESTVVQIDIHARHASTRMVRQCIQYVVPSKVTSCSVELLVIDEAAALPIPCVASLIGAYVVVLASTVTGYEGTGRALQLKLMSRLRSQLGGNRTLVELTMGTPIRYAEGDVIEGWLHTTLCLESPERSLSSSTLPPPEHCALYHVDRDALFSYHPIGEAFLQRIMTLYTAAHYKNSPNDLQILCDAPAHRLFVLLGPRVFSTSMDRDVNAHLPSTGVTPVLKGIPHMASRTGIHGCLPEVLVVMQVAFEGALDSETIATRVSSNETTAGDLIPWTIAHQYRDLDFPRLLGARIIRIVAHSEAQGMGYGSRALELFSEFARCDELRHTVVHGTVCSDGDQCDCTYLFRHPGVDTKAAKALPPLLVPLKQIVPPRLDWIGASFGLTPRLLKFWDRGGFEVVYVRQSQNQATGEYTVIVLNAIDKDSGQGGIQSPWWLVNMVADARCRFVRLLASCFSSLDPFMCLQVLGHTTLKLSADGVDTMRGKVHGDSVCSVCVEHDVDQRTSSMLPVAHGVRFLLTTRDMQRLECFSCNVADHRAISDIAPIVAELVFTGKVQGIVLPTMQAVILLGVGLQRRDLSKLASDVKVTRAQALSLYGKAIRKASTCLRGQLNSTLVANKGTHLATTQGC